MKRSFFRFSDILLKICENGGRCISSDYCECRPGWTGVDCTHPTCNIACGFNQVCVAPDICACKPGYSGVLCNIPLCAQTCLNSGYCSAPDTCSCAPGWFDSNCTTPVCAQTCGNGGNCTAPSTCSCPEEWKGFDCRTPVCSMPCLNGGLCVAPETCHCGPQWSGANCTIPVCSQGFFVANDPILSTYKYSSNNLFRQIYRPCDLPLWCSSTNEFECDQLDIQYIEVEVPSGPLYRQETGRDTQPKKCMEIELPLGYEIPFTLLKSDNSTTGYLRYSPSTPYSSNSLNPWRGYFYPPYDPIDVGHTSPWTYSADRQIALVEYVKMTDGVYACANLGNCSSPDVCECAHGWAGFDCRTPICTQGYYQPEQQDFVSGLKTETELQDFLPFLAYNPVRLQWPYSNPSYEVDYEYYVNYSTIIRELRKEGNLSYLGPENWSSGSGMATLQGGYRCSVRAMTQWENLHYLFNHPNFYSHYMDTSVQLDGEIYTYWVNMSWPPTYSHSKKLDQIFFNLTFVYTDEGYRRLGIWSHIAGTTWEYGACLLQFSRVCLDPTKSLDLLSGLIDIEVQDTDHSFRPRINYTNFNVTSAGRWRAAGGECVDHVVRGCYNNGTCIAPDTCVCATGWSGNDCSIPLCTQRCLHHGNCTLPNICTCEKGWTGFDCSIALCAQECQNDGVCVAPDTCKCSQWPNIFRDGRLGGGRPLFRQPNGDPQYTGWTGFDCSVPICVQSQTYLFDVGNSSSPGYQILGGHGGDNLLPCTEYEGYPLPRCPQYDKKVTSNDGRSFYTGCGYDPLDTGCCVLDESKANCYICPSALILKDAHTFSCNGYPTIVSGYTNDLSALIDFLDANGNLKLCGEYHIPRNYNDSITEADYGTAAYFRNTHEADPKWSSRNYLSNLTSNRFLCARIFWTQGDFIDDAGLGSIIGDGTHYGLQYGRNYRVNDPNYIVSKADITGTTYDVGPPVGLHKFSAYRCFKFPRFPGKDCLNATIMALVWVLISALVVMGGLASTVRRHYAGTYSHPEK